MITVVALQILIWILILILILIVIGVLQISMILVLILVLVGSLVWKLEVDLVGTNPNLLCHVQSVVVVRVEEKNVTNVFRTVDVVKCVVVKGVGLEKKKLVRNPNFFFFKSEIFAWPTQSEMI